MSKKKIVCLVIAAIMLLGVITVNAASANLTGSFYCGNVPAPTSYYLYGNTWFTIYNSDMKSPRITVDHNQFACAAGYKGMSVIEEIRSAGDDYNSRIATPDQGANYGGNPTYTFIQSATFVAGSWGMNSTVKIPIKVTASYVDTWCKDETVVWGYERQPFVKSYDNIYVAERR